MTQSLSEQAETRISLLLKQHPTKVIKMNVSASLVIFKNSPEQLKKLLESIDNSTITVQLTIYDNSPTAELAALFTRHQYHHAGKNIGFGAAHNQAIRKLSSDIHIILNPDIEFESDTIARLINPMLQDPTVIACTPLIHYPDQKLQRLNRLLPSPINLFVRRFLPILGKQLDYEYEMQWFNYDIQLEIPNATGCFLAVRTGILQQEHGFDEQFFMYLEDTDLSRRLLKHGKILFVPDARVIHEFGKASYKNKKLLLIHTLSAIKYFNKWGWIFDSERTYQNNKIQLAKKRLTRPGHNEQKTD